MARVRTLGPEESCCRVDGDAFSSHRHREATSWCPGGGGSRNEATPRKFLSPLWWSEPCPSGRRLPPRIFCPSSSLGSQPCERGLLYRGITRWEVGSLPSPLPWPHLVTGVFLSVPQWPRSPRPHHELRPWESSREPLLRADHSRKSTRTTPLCLSRNTQRVRTWLASPPRDKLPATSRVLRLGSMYHGWAWPVGLALAERHALSPWAGQVL